MGLFGLLFPDHYPTDTVSPAISREQNIAFFAHIKLIIVSRFSSPVSIKPQNALYHKLQNQKV